MRISDPCGHFFNVPRDPDYVALLKVLAQPFLSHAASLLVEQIQERMVLTAEGALAIRTAAAPAE